MTYSKRLLYPSLHRLWSNQYLSKPKEIMENSLTRWISSDLEPLTHIGMSCTVYKCKNCLWLAEKNLKSLSIKIEKNAILFGVNLPKVPTISFAIGWQRNLLVYLHTGVQTWVKSSTHLCFTEYFSSFEKSRFHCFAVATPWKWKILINK